MKYFSKETGFDIPCKLSSTKTFWMKCHILFSRKNEKNIDLSSAEFTQRVIKVKAPITAAAYDILFIIIRK